ncbi:site-specific integrase [Fictibacillus sp. KIGAM418]|uniref:Site-specific integrase n=1 Tax=Fictibacillus marinisediminis TaxID=2878389 RepID=A0A9X1XIH0_9BACL|nr:site-specific integrase [Fictibacillus marinisediminis]MCK6259545.1 site-specific integrase [Fictibacillus marinisediminis]
MQFGYSQYLMQHKKSESTIDENVRQIDYFFSYLDQTYNRSVELHEIKADHIREYFNFKKSTIKESSINKIHSILKSFFNYLWEINKIPYDPMVKIKRFKVKKEEKPILSYKAFQELKSKALERVDYSPLRKAILICSIYGLRPSDFHFIKDDVSYEKSGLVIRLHKRTIFLNEIESDYFLQYYNQAQFNDSPYVFVTKERENETLNPVNKMTIYSNLRVIARNFNVPQFNLNDIRFAYAHYLLTHEGLTIEEIASRMGIETASAVILANECKQITYLEPDSITS